MEICFLEAGSLPARGSASRPGWLALEPPAPAQLCFSALGPDFCSFLLKSWELNPSPHASSASTLPPELFPPSCVIFLMGWNSRTIKVAISKCFLRLPLLPSHSYAALSSLVCSKLPNIPRGCGTHETITTPPLLVLPPGDHHLYSVGWVIVL